MTPEAEARLDALVASLPPLTEAQVEAAARILATVEPTPTSTDQGVAA